MSIPAIDEVSGKNVHTSTVTLINGIPQTFVSPLGIGAVPKVLSVPTSNSASGGSGALTVTTTADTLAENIGVQYYLTSTPLNVLYKSVPTAATFVLTVPAGAYTLQVRSEAGYGSPKTGSGFFSQYSATFAGTAS